MNVCLFGASSDQVDARYKEAVEALGRGLAEAGHTLVFGGGAAGMMGAAARGCREQGGRIVGVSPRFFDVDGILFSDCDEMVFTETMHERKKILRERADAFVITPGGIGTLDEFFEVLSLRQLGQHGKPILLLNVNGCFETLLGLLEEMIAGGFMTSRCRELYTAVDTPEALLRRLAEATEAPTESAEAFRYIR